MSHVFGERPFDPALLIVQREYRNLLDCLFYLQHFESRYFVSIQNENIGVPCVDDFLSIHSTNVDR